MSTRTRADAFARALDAGTPHEHEPLAAALAVARTELADRTTPDAEFRAQLRTRLLAVAAVQPAAGTPSPEPAPRRARWLRPLAGALAGLVVVAGALVGVDTASRDALPGDLLYGVKHAHQELDVRRQDGPLEEGVARLHLAEARLEEVRELIRRGSGTALGGAGSGRVGSGGAVLAAGSDATLIRDTLRDMDRLTRTGSGQVEAVVARTRDLAPLTLLLAWSTMQTKDLLSLAPVLPTAAGDQLRSSLTLVGDLHKRARDALGDD